MGIIDQILDVDLHRWTPVGGWEHGMSPVSGRVASHATTLESNKSVSKTTTMHDLVIGLFINRYEFGLLI